MPIRVAFSSTSARYVDRMLCGIARYAQPPRNWLLTVGDNAPDYVQAGGFAGLLGQLGSLERVCAYEQIGIPIVNLMGHEYEGRLPSIMLDNRAVGQLAAAHFRDRGYRHFGFVGASTGATFMLRQLGFRAGIAEYASSFSVAPVQYTEHPHQYEAMLHWLRGLPKPAAILAGDDRMGLCVTQTCLLGGLHVPEEVAVLGVNDEDTYCEISLPTMSSVDIPWEQIGRAGAALLDQLIRGETPAARSVVLAPLGVITRGSTEIMAISDVEVAQVVGYIRSHAHEPLSVKQILQMFPVGRRSLEQRFRQVLGRTLLEEIHRVRVERAKEQLVHSRQRVQDIARETGFSGPLHLHRVFMRAVGMTPAAYRKRYSAR